MYMLLSLNTRHSRYRNISNVDTSLCFSPRQTRSNDAIPYSVKNLFQRRADFPLVISLVLRYACHGKVPPGYYSGSYIFP